MILIEKWLSPPFLGRLSLVQRSLVFLVRRRRKHSLSKLQLAEFWQITVIALKSPQVEGFTFKPDPETLQVVSASRQGFQEINFSSLRISELLSQVCEYLRREDGPTEPAHFIVKVTMSASHFLLVAQSGDRYFVRSRLFIFHPTRANEELALLFSKSQQTAPNKRARSPTR